MKIQHIEECGCCEVGISPTPEEINNRPGLSKIVYRVGTYTSFRQAMIEAIAKFPTLKDWTARQSDDYGIALIEMWAYLGDILTFYQERIANEAFLRTALHRDTIMRLAAMLDYKLNPGVAATTPLVFFVESGSKVTIPAGLKVQHVPGQNEKPQKFETIEAIEAFSSLNDMRLKTTEPSGLEKGDTTALVKGTHNNLHVGDYILLIGKEREEDPGSERWEVRRLTRVAVDDAGQTTKLSWREGLGKAPYISPPQNPKLFVFRLQVWPFGHNAPNWSLLPKELRDEKDQNAPYQKNWNEKCLPEDENHRDHIFLDTLYNTIHPESWIALVTANPPCPAELKNYPGYTELYHVEEVAETVHANYTLTSNVTRLTVDVVKETVKREGKIQPEHIHYFPMQGTFILAQSEELELVEKPIDKPCAGNHLNIKGDYPDLQDGLTLLLAGELVDNPGQQAAEIVQIATVNPNTHQTETEVILKNDLSGKYKIDTVVIYGNVAEATHGETISAEILGSGDASKPFQEFTLKKSPTTFVPSANAPRGARNTLKVRVGGVLWEEVESLYGQESKNCVYITRVDDDGKMSLCFGNGETGARLPSGQGNVVVAYRQGIGSEGNIRANTLTTLLNRPIGLKSVTNPNQATGGTDSETLQQARQNAPNTVRTFERAISLRDYEDLARSYTGIAKARAAKKFQDEHEIIHLTIAGEKGEAISETSRTYENFVAYLNLHRDPNQLVEVASHDQEPLTLKALIQVAPAYLEENVLAAVRMAVFNYFDFENLQLGQGIHLSDMYAVLQAVPGVTAAVIEHFDYYQESPPALKVHLQIASDRIATLEKFELEVTSDVTRTR